MSVSAPRCERRKSRHRIIRKCIPVLLVLATLPAARSAHAEREPLAPVFTRKTGDDLERRARIEQAEQRTARPAEPEPEKQTVVASPQDIERVLRAALTSVNSGRTEILVRTGDWGGLALATESKDAQGVFKRRGAERGGVLKRTAARQSGGAPAKLLASEGGRRLAQPDIMHLELQPDVLTR